jgi:5-methylcytosine-specific restriction endonuclease McrA
MQQYTLDGHECDGTDNEDNAEFSESEGYTISFRLQRCSAPSCKCESGEPRDLHGPYEIHVHCIDGERKPQYIGVVRDEFKQTTINVIKRDGNVCQRCGDIREGGHFPVHHIRRPEAFDDPQEAHTEDNCVQLCRSCHGKTEAMDPEVQWALFDQPNPIQRSLTTF